MAPIERSSDKLTRVRIVGDHPHKGDFGTLRDDLPMRFGMWRVDLHNGPEGACYAARENLRALPSEEDPDA